jgi:hypothetical protein
LGLGLRVKVLNRVWTSLKSAPGSERANHDDQREEAPFDVISIGVGISQEDGFKNKGFHKRRMSQNVCQSVGMEFTEDLND